ncbi:UDP-N-acetyl-D-mannosamine dehydrogenase [Sphingosinicella humi]|uniref:UDP-N-acetyl-D-mannosamine dehydrogenase n=1 Tax=Allosphingosinicella humi TaxID=2068657 RepID=A0A2U2J1A0_9SPHN|nr:UDP-N-acetyl-D-mannosamine dehydrogenase [Sphingosinicella humi]PWG02103.1 UDP-N-acetyl-D-mannosamine dehydrogenase [Sphingosinicella humi]
MAFEFQTVSVIGLGYIGLPTAAMFASRRLKVIGVDVNPRAVDTINRGEIHIVEPDLDIAVHSAVTEGYLRATSHPERADAFLIAVPTPFRGNNHEPDLSYIEAAARAIAPVLRPGNLVVLESTSPVGATDQLVLWLAAARPDLSFPHQCGDASDIRVAYCPERVLPGKVMMELIHNDRVIGGMTPRCSEAAVALYRIFVEGDCVVTSARTAEMAKLTENSFRDVNIAFANELSIICDKLGIDVWELIGLANRHPRVSILQPGPGVGGHCIAVDPWFIVSSAPHEARLIQTAREVNDAKPAWVVTKVDEAVAGHLTEFPDKEPIDVTIACYGLSFKADINDLRESPALAIAEAIAYKHPGRVVAVEPNIDALSSGSGKLKFLRNVDGVAADVHVMLVDHRQFKDMARPSGAVVDVRGLWRP